MGPCGAGHRPGPVATATGTNQPSNQRCPPPFSRPLQPLLPHLPPVAHVRRCGGRRGFGIEQLRQVLPTLLVVDVAVWAWTHGTRTQTADIASQNASRRMGAMGAAWATSRSVKRLCRRTVDSVIGEVHKVGCLEHEGQPCAGATKGQCRSGRHTHLPRVIAF